MTKVAVRALADKLLAGNTTDVSACVRFVCADTRGLWHGRGRAMMCRRLKHLEVTRDERLQLVGAISRRLISGHFAEQFRDELRLLVALDRNAAFATASMAIQSDREHVRRLGNWLLAAVQRV
jgi:CBS-domain-containing membrane protein